MTLAERPLAGWRVLITRPADQIPPFARALADAGAIPVSYPTITLAPPDSWTPLDQALTTPDAYQWTIFTSPSAVRFTLVRAATISPNAAPFATTRIAAVGSETARALSDRGIKVDLVPPEDDQRQEGLSQALSALAPGTRILFPQTVGGRELLRDSLQQQGCIVDVVAVSQTVAVSPLPPPPPFDVATFASPSALRAFVAARGSSALLGKVVAAIGPTTATAAAAANVLVHVMPVRPSMAALIDALIAYRLTHAPRS